MSQTASNVQMTEDRRALINAYKEPAVTFVRGQGSRLWDTEGREYLDFLCGLAVTSLGHSHPEVAQALSEQARTLLHVSNLFGNTLAPKLASTIDRLVGGGDRGAGGQVFFCNSGAEANECAFKLARKWGGEGRHVVVSAWDSFHGRTLATLHATGQPAKHAPFEPLPEGFVHVPYDDLDELGHACDDERVVGVVLEAIQGEAGVIAPSSDYLRGVRRMCTEREILLIADEVQTGLGRTGRWFAFQHTGAEPDIVTMAKALGNGVPIGACWARAEVAAAFSPGDHGTTFGGQPLAARAALATLDVMERMDVPLRAQSMGRLLREALESLEGVGAVRGDGLLLGAAVEDGRAGEICDRALALGLVVNAPRSDTIRFAPSLLVTEDEIEEAVSMFSRALQDVQGGSQ